MPTYKAKVKTYQTNGHDIWDIIALKCYGDERCMNYIQDANFDYRFQDLFPADIELVVPQEVTIENNLVPLTNIPNIEQLLPWR